MKRLFRSEEDFTKDLVMLEVLEDNGKVYTRDWVKMVVCGKVIKKRRPWVECFESIDSMVAAKRSGGAIYKIIHKKRFCYSVRCSQHMGPKENCNG